MRNIFSSFCQFSEWFPCGKVSISGRQKASGKDDGMGVAKSRLPMAMEEESLRQGAGRGNQNGLDLPADENTLPAGAEVDEGANRVAHQIVAVKVGAAVHEYAIAGVEIEDGVASPIVINEKFCVLRWGDEG